MSQTVDNIMNILREIKEMEVFNPPAAIRATPSALQGFVPPTPEATPEQVAQVRRSFAPQGAAMPMARPAAPTDFRAQVRANQELNRRRMIELELQREREERINRNMQRLIANIQRLPDKEKVELNRRIKEETTPPAQAATPPAQVTPPPVQPTAPAQPAPHTPAPGERIFPKQLPAFSAETAPIVDSFGTKRSREYGINVYNPGVNFAAMTGTPIPSDLSGTVILARSIRGYGRTVMIEKADGTIVMYAHLDQIQVNPGDQINRGAIIGTAGESGLSKGPGVFIRVDVADRQGNYSEINPIPWLKQQRSAP